jgi:hypothetical protein
VRSKVSKQSGHLYLRPHLGVGQWVRNLFRIGPCPRSVFEHNCAPATKNATKKIDDFKQADRLVSTRFLRMLGSIYVSFVPSTRFHSARIFSQSVECMPAAATYAAREVAPCLVQRHHHSVGLLLWIAPIHWHETWRLQSVRCTEKQHTSRKFVSTQITA